MGREPIEIFSRGTGRTGRRWCQGIESPREKQKPLIPLWDKEFRRRTFSPCFSDRRLGEGGRCRNPTKVGFR